MRGRGWLDETRVWHCPPNDFDLTLELRPLHRRDLVGFLAAELPPVNDTAGFPRFLVEFRKREGWDSGIPRSCILVHRFEGPIGQALKTYSYVMSGAKGHQDLKDGDIFSLPIAGILPRAEVLKIDANSNTATIRLSSYSVATLSNARVFNAEFYLRHSPDLSAAFGNNLVRRSIIG
jgi:hypothetical protein